MKPSVANILFVTLKVKLRCKRNQYCNQSIYYKKIIIIKIVIGQIGKKDRN